MRVLFLGTGDIAIPSFRWIANSPKHELVGLVTQPDKPSGRKMTPRPPEIKVIAEELGDFPILQPERIRRCEEELKELSADIFVVMAYGQILPRRVLDIPPVACINLHASILPRHRGASPIQAAILAGEETSGVTVMHMAEGLDTGDAILSENVEITPEETGGSLHDKLADAAPKALSRALDALESGNAPRTHQDDSKATYAPKLDRDVGRIDWSQPAEMISRAVRAYFPWPGTSTKLPDGRNLKLFPPVEIVPGDSCATPGTVVGADNSGLTVAAGDGLVKFQNVQAENRRKMSVGDFLNGDSLEAGQNLG